MPAPYRFSFETDFQYADRVGLGPAYLLLEAQPEKPVAHSVQGPSTTSSERSNLFVIVPWWLVAIVLVVALVGFYLSHRRKLIRQMTQSALGSPALLPRSSSAGPRARRFLTSLAVRGTQALHSASHSGLRASGPRTASSWPRGRPEWETTSNWLRGRAWFVLVLAGRGWMRDRMIEFRRLWKFGFRKHHSSVKPEKGKKRLVRSLRQVPQDTTGRS